MKKKLYFYLPHCIMYTENILHQKQESAMKNQKVLAYCNLFGVLRNIEYLVTNDEECKKAVEGKNLSVQFKVKNGPSGQLTFKNRQAEMKEGFHPSNILLFFTSPEHFNKMIDGKANPIPLKGLTKIGFLTGPFKKIADRLAYYLKPTENLLSDTDYFAKSTEMTFYTAFSALAQIGNHDPKGILNAKHIPDGIIQASIGDKTGLYITAKNGRLTAHKGFAEKSNARLVFKDIEAAQGILSGKTDTYVALATGDLLMKGFIPMVEYMNPILELVSGYLA